MGFFFCPEIVGGRGIGEEFVFLAISSLRQYVLSHINSLWKSKNTNSSPMLYNLQLYKKYQHHTLTNYGETGYIGVSVFLSK